jgi:hypothetical protein
MKQLVAYDLNGTLAEGNQPIDSETSALLARLTELFVAAVISGGDRPQFEHQLLGDLPGGTDWGGCAYSTRPAPSFTVIRFAGKRFMPKCLPSKSACAS